MRVARAFTRRDKVLKFEGGYHGMSDYSLMSLAPKRAGSFPANFPAAVPDSAGIPRVVARRDAGRAVQRHRRGRRASCASTATSWRRSSSSRSSASSRRRRASSQALRKLTAENGIPLIFDEVVTGFRLAYGGAQEYYDVVPDLCTLGKVIGGGFPLAAIAGRADIMAHFDKGKVGDDGFLMQIGTLSGNPVAAAAGLATLEILRRPGAYEQIFATGRELMSTLSQLLREAGIPAQIIGEPPLFDVVFTSDSSRSATIAAPCAATWTSPRRFNALLRERGILKGEQKYYVSLAHTRRGCPAHQRGMGLGDQGAGGLASARWLNRRSGRRR